MGFPDDSVLKNPPANSGDVGSIPGSRRFLGKEMATHSSILTWEIPWIEELGGLQSTGPQRVRHSLARKQQQPVFVHLGPWTMLHQFDLQGQC